MQLSSSCKFSAVEPRGPRLSRGQSGCVLSNESVVAATRVFQKRGNGDLGTAWCSGHAVESHKHFASDGLRSQNRDPACLYLGDPSYAANALHLHKESTDPQQLIR